MKKEKKIKLAHKINLEDNTLSVPHRGVNRLYKWNIISIKRDEVRIHEQALKTLAKLNKPNKGSYCVLLLIQNVRIGKFIDRGSRLDVLG